ncbi:hypothetical protein [Paracoccus marcusii]|uniref:Uncharacterized protein n=1 Tax=Paracoccus marcusii TaxID=59779 RepID=A0ABY7UN03_9RHOB|nr:hypothetical protein [Paracoccus marcusii]WDA11316.1 hypothetical protein PRL19_08250 [Paracoccus marcusii]
MKLPAELVIIAEDSRFDRETNRRDLLDAAALLNAAGRAGRAGQSASGIVLIIPGRVVPLSDKDGTIGRQSTQLREVFSQSDQCLVHEYPFEAVMDRIHYEAEDAGDLERYVVSRLTETHLDGEDGGRIESICPEALQLSESIKRLTNNWLRAERGPLCLSYPPWIKMPLCSIRGTGTLL